MKPLFLVLIVGALALQARAQAQAPYPQYVISWRGTGYMKDSAGNMQKVRMTDKDLVQIAATNNGLDPKQLALVYRVEARDTAVVWKKDGSFVADVMQVQYVYVDVPNANDTRAVRQALLYYDPYDMTPIGSVFGTETAARDAAGNLRSYSFKGTFQYALPDQDAVFSGTFATGQALNDITRGA